MARQPGTSGSPYTASSSPKSLTSERIAADIAAFNKAGGHIEKLGNTPIHSKRDEAAPANPADTGAAPAKPSKQK